MVRPLGLIKPISSQIWLIVYLLFWYKLFDCQLKLLSSQSRILEKALLEGSGRQDLLQACLKGLVIIALVDKWRAAIVASAVPWIWVLEHSGRRGGERTKLALTQSQSYTGWPVSIKNRPMFTQHPTPSPEVANITTVPGFYVGAEVQNSGPCDCLESALPTDLSR